MLLIITPEDICWNIQKVKLKFNHEARSAQASHVSLMTRSDLLFDCSRVLEYAKTRTVLQSKALCKRKSL